MKAANYLRLAAARAGSWCCFGAAVACSGEPLTPALEEPIRVQGAQFREGTLPGRPPLTLEEIKAGVSPSAPSIASFDLGNAFIPRGEPSRRFAGRTTQDAVALGVQFAELGTGYWVIPTGSADVINDGQLLWSFNAAFARNAPAGRHTLLFSAIDSAGRAGTQTAVELCLESEVPDNGNACRPSVAPPALVVSLSWDAPVDLDLVVISPGGNVTDAKHPSTALPDDKGKVDTSTPGTGVLDRDSNASCVIDSRQRENLVFQDLPPSGTYLVYANLFDACGERGVAFDVSLHNATSGVEPDTLALVQTYRQSGSLQAVHANGGSKLGLFVTQFIVP